MIDWDRRRFACGDAFTLTVSIPGPTRTLASWTTLTGDALRAVVYAPGATAATLTKDLDSGVSATPHLLKLDVGADELTVGVHRVEFWLGSDDGGPRLVAAGPLELVASGGAL